MHNSHKKARARGLFNSSSDFGLNFKFNHIISQLGDKNWYNRIMNYFDENLKGIPFINLVCSQLDITRTQLTLGLFIVLFLFITIGPGTEIIYMFISLLYPALRCYMLLVNLSTIPIDPDFPHSQSPTNSSGARGNLSAASQNELIFWLRYWTVLALFTFAWYFVYTIISFIPFISLLRIAFVVSLYHPSTKAANVLFNLFVSPLLTKYQLVVNFIVRFMEKSLMFSYNILAEASRATNFSR